MTADGFFPYSNGSGPTTESAMSSRATPDAQLEFYKDLLEEINNLDKS